MLVPIIADNLTPDGIPLQGLHIASGKGILEHRLKHNHNKILLGIVFLQIQAFQIAIIPFLIVAALDGIVLHEPVVVASRELQGGAGEEEGE